MAVKTVYEVGVDDSEFKAFAELFNKYQAQLAKTPSAWAEVNKENKAAHESFKSIAAALLAQNELTRKASENAKEMANAAHATDASWGKVYSTTKKVGENIVGATTSLLKWTGIATAFSGLLGVDGLWGLDRLAASVAGGRAAAAGLGIGYGQRKAFELNFGGRFLESPEGTLGAIARGQFDITSPEYRALHANLRAAGVAPTGNAADIAAQIVEAIPRIFADIPKDRPELLAARARIFGLEELGFSVADINRIRNATPEERARQLQQYKEDTRTFGLTPQEQLGWNNLLTALQRAGATIEKVFVRGLTRMTVPLEHLSKAFTDVVSAFLGNKVFKKWIEDAASGLESLAKTISGPEFKENIDYFINKIGEVGNILYDIAVGLRDILALVTSWFGEPTPPPPHEETPWERHRRHEGEKEAARPHPDTASPPNLEGAIARKNRLRREQNIAEPPSATKQYFRDLEQQYNLPSGLLTSVYGQESSYGKNLVSPTGALGPFQFTKRAAKDYGVENRMDLAQSAAGAAKYLSHELQEFGGDLEKAVAAYNKGPGVVKDLVRQYGESWKEHLSAGTQKYVDEILGRITSGSAPSQQAEKRKSPYTLSSLHIYNNTGGSAIIAASQLAI